MEIIGNIACLKRKSLTIKYFLVFLLTVRVEELLT